MKQEKQARKDTSSRINDGHYLEIMDRLHCQMSNIEDHLLDHPVSQKYDELREHIIRAIVNLIQAYQISGDLASANTLKKKKKKR